MSADCEHDFILAMGDAGFCWYCRHCRTTKALFDPPADLDEARAQLVATIRQIQDAGFTVWGFDDGSIHIGQEGGGATWIDPENLGDTPERAAAEREREAEARRAQMRIADRRSIHEQNEADPPVRANFEPDVVGGTDVYGSLEDSFQEEPDRGAH